MMLDQVLVNKTKYFRLWQYDEVWLLSCNMSALWIMGYNIMNDPIIDIELTYQYELLVKTLATLEVEWHRILCTKTEHSSDFY